LEEDWKGLGFDSKFTSSEAVEAISVMTSQAQMINQACKVAKNRQEEKWTLKVALAHNYYMTCMLWREIADFAIKKNMRLTMIITDKYINILDYSIKKLQRCAAHGLIFMKLQRCAAHGLIFKHFPLLMLSGMTANQINEYRTLFFNNLMHRTIKESFWSSFPQHLLDETQISIPGLPLQEQI